MCLRARISLPERRGRREDRRRGDCRRQRGYLHPVLGPLHRGPEGVEEVRALVLANQAHEARGGEQQDGNNWRSTMHEQNTID